jgi:RHS repeat-associated protein
VVGLTDGGAKLAGRYSYDAWGQTDTSIPDPQLGTKNKFRYTGEALDPGTQLYYLRARYYDPSVGRFLSRDAFEGLVIQPISLNRFPYVLNNPMRFVDASGLSRDLPRQVFSASPVTAFVSARGEGLNAVIPRTSRSLTYDLLTISLGPVASDLITITPEKIKSAADELFSSRQVPGIYQVLEPVAPLAPLLIPVGGELLLYAYPAFATGYLAGRTIAIIPGAEDALGRAWLYLNLPTGVN